MLKIVSWLIVAAGFCFICTYGMQSGRQSDFAGYYTAAKLFATTDSISRMYDDPWFIGAMHRFGIPDSTIVMYVNPPPIAAFMLPVSWLEPTTAKTVWNVANIILLLLAFQLMRSLFNVSLTSFHAPLLAALVGCTIPFLRNLQRGQIYIFMLVLVLILIQSYTNEKPFLTGFSLATLLLLKYFGWMFLLLFIVERKWKELAATFLFLVIGFAAGIMFFGIETYSAHFTTLRMAFDSHDFAITGLPNVPAFYGGLLTFHSQWNRGPVAHLPWLAEALALGTLAVALSFSLRSTSPQPRLSQPRLSQPRLSQRRFMTLLTLSVIFTPLAADHHYALLIPPTFLILSRWHAKKASWAFTAALCVALLGWYPTPTIGALSGFGKLLCFPRLYAAVILWLVILRSDRHDDAATR